MSRMFGDRRIRPWWVSGAILGAAFLTLAISFCLFDADHGSSNGHFLSPDLCLGLLPAMSAVVFAARLPLSGSALTHHLARIPVSTLHVPAPPPKSL